jgi:hypothetical protein
MWIPIGNRMKSSISFLFNSWPKSNQNNTNFVFSDCYSQSSRIWHQYLDCRFQVLLAEPNLITVLIVQKCMIILVLSLSLKAGLEILPVGIDLLHECACWFSFDDQMPSMWVTLIYPRTSLYGQNCHPLIEQDVLYGRFQLSFGLWSRIVSPTLPTCIVKQLLVRYR